MSNMQIIKFENHKIPEFKEVRGKEWVYYGDDNKYPEYLIELGLRSAKHNAILNAKVNYIYGGGLVSGTKGASLESQAKSNEFIRQLNEQGFLRKMIQDFEWFNGFFIEFIFNKAKTKISSINYIPFSKIRVSADEKTYYYSNDWSQTQQSEEKTGLKEFKPLDLENPTSNQLLYFKVLSPKNGKDRNVYPVPEYIGGCASIETDIEIANYHLNNIKTGFSVGTIINFNNGQPEKEAQEAIERGVKKKFQGTDRAGSVMLTFNNSTDNAPTITSFAPSDLDKQFIEIAKRVEQDIFTAHKITSPMLFGVKTEGQLGGRNEMIDAFELFQNTYIEVRQTMIESVINEIANYVGVTTEIRFKRVQAVQRNLPDSIIERVYNSYSDEQLAEIMGLPKAKKIIPVQMQSEEIYEVLFEREWKGQDDEEMKQDFISMNFKSELTSKERSIVDLLNKDSLMPTEDIAKILKIGEKEVNNIISDLNGNGYLDGSVPTSTAIDIVEEDGAKTADIEVRYHYEWRPEVKDKDIKDSREFCQEMLSKTQGQKNWMTRDEIESLDNGQGLDVFDSRGGWWNRNGVNLPFCRHLWIASIVKKK